MSRLRRPNYNSRQIPNAAEVLEVRSLLSAGASAVHAAMHHAAIQSPAVKPPPAFQGSAGGQILISGQTNPIVAGTAFVSHITQTVGSKVTASFKLSFSDGGTPATINGKFTGTIRQITPGKPTIYTLQPTGGKLTLTEKVDGKTIKATATPNTENSAVDLDKIGLAAVTVIYDFPAKAKGGFEGKTIILDISPLP